MKPCRDCGSYGKVKSSDFAGVTRYWVKCGLCVRCGNEASTPAEAIDMWDRGSPWPEEVWEHPKTKEAFVVDPNRYRDEIDKANPDRLYSCRSILEGNWCSNRVSERRYREIMAGGFVKVLDVLVFEVALTLGESAYLYTSLANTKSTQLRPYSFPYPAKGILP